MSTAMALEKKKKLNTKSVLMDTLKMLVFIILLGTFSATTLVSLENYTLNMVATNVGAGLQKGVLSALHLEYTDETVEQVFNENITIESVGEITLYQVSNGNFATQFNGEGLWGPISGVIALSSDLKTIEGLSILEQQETPGLGARIVEEEFLGQFKGVEVDPQLIVKKGEPAVNGNEVDGISGASMTSKAMENMLNEHITNLRELLEVK